MLKNDADMTFTAINTLPQKRKDTVIVKTYVPEANLQLSMKREMM